MYIEASEDIVRKMYHGGYSGAALKLGVQNFASDYEWKTCCVVCIEDSSIILLHAVHQGQ